ncbi:abortive infection family protein [Burkholderia pseudomallei]|uniref:abortive infection family protein n=1 Tax=Burkholderia pseudomallei TaxID=28450 RepID=UPI0022D719A0|nr:abortive infection family protein [Burkholderia pseudomallei]MDA0558323.1 abortive infection family protein [Burkholderia pseudomallei]
MKISEYTVEFLGNLIAGDMDGTPYRSGPQLVKFFNGFGGRDVYPASGGFPTRRIYAQDKLRELNGSSTLRQVISSALDPRAFMKNELALEPIVEKVNDNLKHDGYEIVKDGLAFKVRELSAGSVKLSAPAQVSHELSQLAIDENIRKCEEKLVDGDFSGAITNARSLVESVLIGIEKEFDGQAPEYDGNMQALYKRVQKLLHLEPDRKDISDSLRQILSGLVSVVAGLAAVRNKMGDAHATSYRPSRHHAKLAVHAAVTLSDFLFESKNYQQAREPVKQGGEAGGKSL